ncbi:sigma-70 family RNA polymerase sigma factor [Lederbergia citrisecunda]|uniref:sigma-70 family RNA polymerase sigma factor n=1 Tax=Lederbergia citrisecunda TaxID=2833583 RepID=UPI003D29A52B
MRTEAEIMKLYNEYEKYIEATARKRFYNKEMQSLHGITYDEIIQHGRLGLYKACEEYDPSKNTSFRTFAISNIFWAMSTECKRESLSRDKSWSFDTVDKVSLDHTMPGESDEIETMHDALPDPLATEKYNRIQFEESLERIKELITTQVYEIVKLRIEGYTLAEVGEKLGVTHQRVSHLLRQHKDKIKIILGLNMSSNKQY